MSAADLAPLMATDLLSAGLISGLPYVRRNGRAVLFSPYARKLWDFPSELLGSKELENAVSQSCVTGMPSPRVEPPSEVMKIGLVLTTQCNLRCRYCYLSGDTKPVDLGTETMDSVLKYLLDRRPPLVVIHFFGGEPTLFAHEICRLVETLECEGITFIAHVSSNGTAPVSLYSELSAKGLYFTISSDGVPGVQNEFRTNALGRGTAESVESCLRALAEQNALFMVRATLTASGAKILDQAMGYWADLGVKYVHFEPVRGVAGTKSHGLCEQLSPQTYVQNVLAGVDVAEERGLLLTCSAYMNLLHPTLRFCTLCSGGGITVTPDGSLSACYRVQESSDTNPFIVGSWDRRSSIPRFVDHRRSALNSVSVESFDQCNTCHARYICSGGCPQRNFSATGGWSSAEPWACTVKKEIVADAIWRMLDATSAGCWPAVCGYDSFAASVARTRKVGNPSAALVGPVAALHVARPPDGSAKLPVNSAIEYQLPFLSREAAAVARLLERSESCL